MQSDDFSDCDIKDEATVHNQLELSSDSADNALRLLTLAKKKSIKSYIETAIAEAV